MKTIEERAYKKYPVSSDEEMESEMLSPRRQAYIADCAEQKSIDIEKACEWLDANITCMDDETRAFFLMRFKKAMEE